MPLNFKQFEELKRLHGELKTPVVQQATESTGSAPVSPAPTTPSVTPEKSSNPVGQFAEGVAKETFGTLAKLGERVASQTVGRVVNAVEGKGFTPTEIGGNQFTEALNAPSESGPETAGKIAGNIVSLAVPGSAVTKATKGAGFLARTATRAATSGAIVSAQEDNIGSGTAIATGAEVLLPVAGKLLKPTTRLIKSLASGLSGASSGKIEAIANETGVAKKIAKEVDLGGETDVIKRNAETIINGVSKIRQDARKAYGEGIGKLKETDINPKVFRDSVSSVLNKYGSKVTNGVRKLKNVEFDTPKDLKRASTIINKISKVKLDGLSLNQLYNQIEDMAYKTTGSDANRLAFNAFVKDMSKAVRDSVKQSTNKLDEINKSYSTDLQLTEAVEGILGGVEFKNLNEVRKVSEKLETLFSKKGLSPKIIDDFLTKIGVKPSEFRASEAVRQISGIEDRANQMGLNFSEMIRGLTSSIITPQAVRDAAILTGMAEKSLLPTLQKLAPSARAGFIRSLVEGVNGLD